MSKEVIADIREGIIIGLWIFLGIYIGTFLTIRHYEDKYIHLRSEIQSITGVDITYPYSTPMIIDRRTNKAWFDNAELNCD